MQDNKNYVLIGCEWVTYTNSEGVEKKFPSYFVVVGTTKIKIKGADSKDSQYNHNLLDASRKLGLIPTYDRENN